MVLQVWSGLSGAVACGMVSPTVVAAQGKHWAWLVLPSLPAHSWHPCRCCTAAVLAPGSVLPPGRRIPSGQLWAGTPAKFVRDLTKDEVGACAVLGWVGGVRWMGGCTGRVRWGEGD